MDQITNLGREVRDHIVQTYQAYTPLLQNQAGRIKSTPVETCHYGPHPTRHTLDLYTPATHQQPARPNSILIFLYGGGFVQGDRIISDIPDGLVYANLGHYFAETLGFPVAILDYRLISHGAKFPSGGEDLQQAVQWIQQRFASEANPVSLYVMGNSAGGLCIADFLFAPDFADSRRELLESSRSTASLKGVVLLSVPVEFNPNSRTRQVAEKYYGSEIDSNSSLALLKAMKNDDMSDELEKLPILLVAGSLDTDDVLISNSTFLEHSSGMAVSSCTLHGHNHISPPLGLGTGIPGEEELGKRVVDFFTSDSNRRTIVS